MRRPWNGAGRSRMWYRTMSPTSGGPSAATSGTACSTTRTGRSAGSSRAHTSSDWIPTTTGGPPCRYYARSSSRRRLDFVATVRDANDGRTVFTQRDDRTLQRSNEPRIEGYAVEIPLRNLTPGMYILGAEAVIRNDNDELAFREIPFEVR